MDNVFYVDGGTANNGKFGFQKSVICATDNRGTMLFLSAIGDKTNNEAELLAVLELIKKVPDTQIRIFSDSRLAVNLVKKKWKTLIDRLRIILENIWIEPKQITIKWIPREKNKAGWLIEEIYGL